MTGGGSHRCTMQPLTGGTATSAGSSPSSKISPSSKSLSLMLQTKVSSLHWDTSHRARPV